MSGTMTSNRSLVTKRVWRRLLLLLSFAMLPGMAAAQVPAPGRFPATESPYTYTTPSRGGTGKIYMGREIARVMGHRGAAWLERPSRVHEELPQRVVGAMALRPDAEVADVGAGTGYFTLRIAREVPRGQVYAVDIQNEMLDIIRQRASRLSLANITPVLAGSDDPRLPPASIDAALLVDAYHEFSYPYEVMQALVAALRPGGKLYLVEYRGEDPRVAVKPLHKMTQQQAKRELHAVGLQWWETLDVLPTQHLMVFEKPAGTGAAGSEPPRGTAAGR